MLVKGVRMYGKADLRFETFDIGEMGEEELLARVVTDSLCMSTYKAALQGSDHRAVPDGIDRSPVVIGHEFCAVVEKVGARADTDLRVGDVFTVQPKMFLEGEIRGPGYSFGAYGGDITHIRAAPRAAAISCPIAAGAISAPPSPSRIPASSAPCARNITSRPITSATSWARAPAVAWPCWPAAAPWASAWPSAP